jgi:hypothetical protein
MAGMQAKLIPGILGHPFDDVKLGVPFLLMGGIV